MQKNQDKKRVLTIDGGGIRGVIALGILSHIETHLRDVTGDPDYRLSSFYDFISGTSTGGILAACLAVGMSTDEIRPFYIERGKKMFERAGWTKRLYHKYSDSSLTHELKSVFGTDTTLGSDKLKTLLMIVMRNASTGSPWLVTNNPKAKFNNPDAEDCNLNVPLWQLIRASTAAPSFFPPERIKLGPREFLFVDGGVTPYNNPSFMSFLVTTAEAYQIQWPASLDTMLITSVGTGLVPDEKIDLAAKDMHLAFTATQTPTALINAAAVEQDVLCRMFGECLVGGHIDLEVGNLRNHQGPTEQKLFTYLRYNPDLTKSGLAEINCSHHKPQNLWKLDAIDQIGALLEVGHSYGESFVLRDHFERFI